MDMDRAACYRAIATRDARFDGRLFVGVQDHRHLLPADLPGAHAETRELTFYPAAAAAQEAGFRPCLRCRPETSPDLASWRGTSNTVSRALALIEAGALDGGDVEALAERLGVGERQLRRLFRQHIGASPIAVAQTRRVLLAKQLIHETGCRWPRSRWRRASAACAASTRPFSELFGRPPRALRAVRRAESPAPKPARACACPIGRPTTGRRCWRSSARGRSPASSRWTAMPTPAPSPSAALAAWSRGAGASNRLDVTVRFPELSALPAIIARVRRVFDLAADP